MKTQLIHPLLLIGIALFIHACFEAYPIPVDEDSITSATDTVTSAIETTSLSNPSSDQTTTFDSSTTHDSTTSSTEPLTTITSSDPGINLDAPSPTPLSAQFCGTVDSALEWNTVTHAVSYEFRLRTDTYDAPSTFTANEYLPDPALPPDTYFWQVRAKSSCSPTPCYSTWSDEATFTIAKQPEPNPIITLTSPSDDPAPMLDMLRWADTTPIPDNGYKVQLFKDACDGTEIFLDTVLTNELSTGMLEDAGIYYWKVQPLSHGACEEGNWSACASFQVLPAVDIITNGSFEGSMTGWSSANIDHYTGWSAPSGSYSIDLNGTTIGYVQTTITTTPGTSYKLGCYMAGNVDGGPTLKTMEIYFDGDLVDTPSFDITGKTKPAMGWVYLEYTVTASSNSTVLRFESGVSGSYGPALDWVTLFEI